MSRGHYERIGKKRGAHKARVTYTIQHTCGFPEPSQGPWSDPELCYWHNWGVPPEYQGKAWFGGDHCRICRGRLVAGEVSVDSPGPHSGVGPAYVRGLMQASYAERMAKHGAK